MENRVMNNTVNVGERELANNLPFVLIAGPCVIESRDLCLRIAAFMANQCALLGIPYIFKASYDKANRTSVGGQRGVGMTEGLSILREVQRDVGCPVTTDVHSPDEVTYAATVVDIIQIPAALSKQTDLLVAAGKTKLPVNIKRSPALHPLQMAHAGAKVVKGGGQPIFTERGSAFGYGDLVLDIRNFARMAVDGDPVVADVSHSAQTYHGGFSSGGDRPHIPRLARAAVAAGVAGVFVECHPDPNSAMSDGATSMHMEDMPGLLAQLKAIDLLVKPSS